jgi:hypothetical protein
MRLAFEAWCGVAAAAVLIACDRGTDARGVSAGLASVAEPSATVAASSNPSFVRSHEQWPAKASEAGHEFSAGIVDYRPPPKEVALLSDVRAARHEGFDRIVFEFAGGSPPGYHLEYIDKPVRKCGSGDATAIAGDGWLEVRFEPANAHTTAGAPAIAHRDQLVDMVVVKQLQQTCDFEAVVSWVIGVRRPNPYRVLALNDPTRLVVDVRH